MMTKLSILEPLRFDPRKLPSEAIQNIITENTKFRQAWALAELGLEGITEDEFRTRWPGVEPAELLTDNEIEQLVEKIAARRDVKTSALEAAILRTASANIRVLNERLTDPDCSASTANEIGITLVRLYGLLKQSNNKKESTPKRNIQFLFSKALAYTPEYPDGVGIALTSEADALQLLRYARCTTKAEVDAVIDGMAELWVNGSIVLRGW